MFGDLLISSNIVDVHQSTEKTTMLHSFVMFLQNPGPEVLLR